MQRGDTGVNGARLRLGVVSSKLLAKRQQRGGCLRLRQIQPADRLVPERGEGRVGLPDFPGEAKKALPCFPRGCFRDVVQRLRQRQQTAYNIAAQKGKCIRQAVQQARLLLRQPEPVRFP